MSQKLKQSLSLVLFGFIVIFLVYYLKNHWQDFSQIKIVSWWAFAGLTFLTPVVFWVTAWSFLVSLEPYNLKLKFKEYFGLTMITLLGNYFIPFSGIGVRAVYMKKNFDFSYTNFLVTVIGNWVTNFLIYSSAAVLALIVYYDKTKIFSWPLMTIFLGVTLISLATFIPLKIRSSKKRAKILGSIINVFKSWQKYIKHPDLLRRLLVITFWQFLLNSLIFYLAYLTFGFKLTFIDSFLASALSLYSSVIRLVPASLGFYEISVVYPSRILGLSVADGLAVSAVTRFAVMLWTFALGIVFSYILIRPFKQKKKK